jgi:hypothetical protein
MTASHVVLLGPQRFRPEVADAVGSLAVEGPVATVTAGWQEREPDDAELDGLLAGRSVNLGLHARWLDVVEREPGFADADRRRHDALEELQAVYLLRLRYALEAVYELQRHASDRDVAEAEVADAIAAVRALDTRHLERVAEVQAAFHDTWSHGERAVVAAHREAVDRIVGEAGALVIAGGHVGAQLVCLQIFDVAAALGGRPVVAWSAGAMAVSERVVLFHDLAAHSPGHAEVYDTGLGLCRGIVPLPHARRRLRVDDRRRMALLARRFAPAHCVVLEGGARLDCPGGDWDSSSGITVGEDGRLRPVAA